MRVAALLAGAVLVAAVDARAEAGRQPVRAFDVDDGLAHSFVGRIVADSRGFLWFCTARGLSRFDGRGFVTFGSADGLAGPEVLDLVEDSDRSTYWVGTSEGLFRFAGNRPPATGRLFEKVELPVGGSVRRLLSDRAGRIWAGTGEGLAVLLPAAEGRKPRRILPAEGAKGGATAVLALLEDDEGAIWAGTHDRGLFRVAPDLGDVLRFPENIPGLFFIRDLAKGPDGRIWCSFLGGVVRLHPTPDTKGNPVADAFDRASGIPSVDTTDLLATAGGEILVGTTAGVARLTRDAGGHWRVRERWTTRDGLESDLVGALALDPAGNLWIGTSTRGAMRLLRGGLRRYPEVEESASFLVGLSGDGGAGMVVLAAVEQRRYRLHHLSPEGHSAIDVRMPRDISYLGWGAPRIVRDVTGSWWVATGNGLVRYGGRDGGPNRLGSRPDKVFGPEDGLPGADVFSVFADSRGGIWVSVSGPLPGRSSVAHRESGARSFSTFPHPIGSSPGDLAIRFAEDRTGAVWIRFASGRVTRVGPGGTFAPVAFQPPVPQSSGRCLAFDSRHRLWIASDGVHIADEPLAETVRIRPGPAELRDATVNCLVEDEAGRLYFGTDRGVVRLDESAHTLRRFTTADGLPGDGILQCGKDAKGGLWFADLQGVARLEPGADPGPRPPQVRIASVRIDGVPLPIAPLGSASLGPLALRSRPRHVEVAFFAIGHAPGQNLPFQHRFEEGADWSAPSGNQTLDFPRLAPGRHRLFLRAVPSQGGSATPAMLELLIPAPLWQRPWFLALVFGATLAALFVAYRIRLTRALAFERMRTRIATDLHDEVGADLSRISLLAEIVRRDLDERPSRARALLEEVARTARGAVADMSDIVWALKPGRGDLAEVVARVGDFAAEIAVPAGTALRIATDDDLEGILLAGEHRRELYLLLKEAVVNAIRHAGARSLELEVRRVERGIVATVRDDGRGFSPAPPPTGRGGHGLGNMRARAERLGGVLLIQSTPGQGTVIRLVLPRA